VTIHVEVRTLSSPCWVLVVSNPSPSAYAADPSPKIDPYDQSKVPWKLSHPPTSREKKSFWSRAAEVMVLAITNSLPEPPSS